MEGLAMISTDRKLSAVDSRIRAATDLGPEHRAILLRLAYKCLGRRAIRPDAEDLVSTVLVHLLQHIERGGVVERFLPWASSATRKAAVSLWGRTSHQVESSSDPRDLDRHPNTAGRGGDSAWWLPSIAELAPLFLAHIALPRRQSEYLEAMAEHPGATNYQLAGLLKVSRRNAREIRRALQARLQKAVERGEVPGLEEVLEMLRREEERERERERERGAVAERRRGDAQVRSPPSRSSPWGSSGGQWGGPGIASVVQFLSSRHAARSTLRGARSGFRFPRGREHFSSRAESEHSIASANDKGRVLRGW
jgi:DNA-directed RNA polymerase specialized sigma24 family protein